jgi:hypothetical protein
MLMVLLGAGARTALWAQDMPLGGLHRVADPSTAQPRPSCVWLQGLVRSGEGFYCIVRVPK